MTLTRLTALNGESILPLADAKAQVRVLHAEEDALISALRDAAVSHVERVSGVALAEARYLWTMASFPCRVGLPMHPVTAIDEVSYHDADGTDQTYADARLVDGSAYAAAGGVWPAAYGYAAVKFTAGLASPDEAPELIAAAKLLLGHLYTHREAVSDKAVQQVPLGVDALVGTYRQVMV